MNSPLLIDHVAETTAQRDRGALDLSVVRLLMQFLDARAVTLHRVVEHAKVKRVARGAAITREQGEIAADLLQDTAALPTLADEAGLLDCVNANRVVEENGSDGAVTYLFPVEGEREVTGVLEIDLAAPMHARDDRLVRGILRILKNQLSLLDYGERDTLTGLLNRKTFEARFDKLCRALREQPRAAPAPERPNWLGLLDVDHFKSINDGYGHLFGDEVLLLISQIMMRTLRGADQLFRFGGEEFVIVLDEVAPAGAHIAFERVRAAVEAHTFPQVGRVTISLGYTQIRPQDVPATCIERADAALYYAKHNGRNNTRDHAALVAAGALGDTSDGDGGDVELF
jgi:diguanylate cyclase (GGDEF)-like protein